MNNNKSKQSNYKKSFFKCTDGSAIIAFAIMIPAILVCMLMSINYTQTLRNRARISEATNEASLFLDISDYGPHYSAHGSGYTYHLDDKRGALRYINYFLYRKISNDLVNSASIDVKYDKDKQEYYVIYKQKFDSLIGSNLNIWNSELDQPAIVGNNTKSYGNTRKYDIFDTFDIAFIVDFSGSTTCQYSDVSCNAYTEANNNSQRRLDYTKKAMIDIIEKYKDRPEYHFAFVPYDIGVPVVSTQTSNRDLKVGYNCSIMYELKPQYKSLNYKFWANKNIAYQIWRSLKERGEFRNYDYLNYNYFSRKRNTVYSYLDYSNYLYYSKILGPALGADDDRKLVDRGLCYIRNGGGQSGAARLACGTANEYYPLDPRNKNTIETQYASMVSLYDNMFSGNNPSVHYSFANIETIDVSATLRKLDSFSDLESMIIDFERPLAPPTADFSPFQGMCQSPLYSSGFMSEEMLSLSDEDKLKKASEKLRTVISSNHVKLPYLIPFSDDINHTNNLLNVLKNSDWKPGGGTDTMTALLRTIPEMAKGRSKHKAMIIISDGKDDAGADILRDRFIDRGVCYLALRGLESREFEARGYIAKAAEDARIFYIKLDPNARGGSNYNDTDFGKWTRCVDHGFGMHLFVAHDYQSLSKELAKIFKFETGNFINKN
ncbi:VWA domain-containing protein [Gilliamella sp. Pas-s25]|uniref:VWA domain-containing protein n=1 Tax=Gilliamella sp. Pas-s25 TaxID=2687310 RepID=UPI00135F0505|nr:VWA domain-containing protein [Gilliamella sp. Pas-s25]MWP62646.1 hypothetical protein [Gilliamella sp. Pas-s25]